MTVQEHIINQMQKSKQTYFTLQEIVKMCGFARGFDTKIVHEELEKLVKADKLLLTSKHKYALTAKATNVHKGEVIGTRQDYAFLRCENLEDDVLCRERDLHGATHGDIVLFQLKNNAKRIGRKVKKAEAEVIKILERGVTSLVGTTRATVGGVLVIPDDTRFTDTVFVPMLSAKNVPENYKVVVKITVYPSRTTMAQGEITEILGDSTNFKVSTLAVVRSFNLTETFPENVQAEAKKVAVRPSVEELKKRKDIRNIKCITIDGEDARDFDDAISLEMKKNGNYYLGVHIADVSHYVKAGSALDQEAFLRGTSVYFPDMVLPMLPVELSNDVCSLNEKTDKLTLSVFMEMDKKGNVVHHEIAETYMESAHRMTYTEVTQIFENNQEMRAKYKDVVPMLDSMAQLAQILIEKREKEGNIDFNLPEVAFELNEAYEVVNIKRKPRTLSERLIEMFMVLTNEVIAKQMHELKAPFVYRVHETPTPEKIKAFKEYLQTFGLSLQASPDRVKPIDLQAVLHQVQGTETETIISSVMLKSMQKARYAPENLGHFGLALKNYCHFTSPIRRYPDLLIHRIIKHWLHGTLQGGTLQALQNYVVVASEQSSLTERRADEAERAVDDLKKAEFMSKHIGETYNGTITGVIESGIFVSLENTVEGFIYTEDLPQDHYIFEEKRYRLVGKKHAFALGKKLFVKVKEVDLVMRRVQFELAENEGKNTENAMFL